MKQRAIKTRVDRQIQLHKTEATILETVTIVDGKISTINVNPGSYTSLTDMNITIADPPSFSENKKEERQGEKNDTQKV
jgi:hypothetical protein